MIKKYYLDELKGPKINYIERVSIINKNILDKGDVKVINKVKNNFFNTFKYPKATIYTSFRYRKS